MVGNLSKIEAFNHLVYNVFLPLRLPQSELDEYSSQQVDLLITQSTINSIRGYKEDDPANRLRWDRMSRMLEGLASHLQVPLNKASLTRDMLHMDTHDVLTLYIRAQNAAIIVRKGPTSTFFTIFEVQAPAEDVMSNPGKLALRYPGPAVEIPESIAGDPEFIRELANFLEQSDTKSFEEAVATTHKAGSTVRETRETTDPNYFTQLFLGILGGMGTVFCPPRIVKRIADEVLWKDARNPWRRSPIWLIIRVALQISLDSTLLYKHFMVYHHALLITQCLNRFSKPFSSEVLFMMRAKLARRLLKIQDSAPAFIVEAARAAAEGSQDILQERWTVVQEQQARSQEWDPSEFDLDAATNITLPNSRAYLDEILRGRNNRIVPSAFTPGDSSRLDKVQDLSEYAEGGLDRTFSRHKHMALFDFESYVHENLKKWVDRNLSNAETACRIIYSCFQQYLSAARSHYVVDIADQSIMILTVMALWVAIDQLATSACSLLLRFSPEIPSSILDPLLLCSSRHLEQARLIQLYIRRRQEGTRPENSSAFSNKWDVNCFGVQYFRQTSALQALKSNIEASAQEARQQKITELEDKNRQSTQLSRQAEQMEHEYVPDQNCSSKPNTGQSQPMKHVKSCKRCKLEKQIRGMQISPHEWPLPTNREEAETVVFELQRPEFFTIWRDITYKIVWDLATESGKKGTLSIKGTVESYNGLQRWRGSSDTTQARIILASLTKSFNRAHYSKVTIPANRASVCVNNGLSFQLYDQTGRISAAGPFNRLSFAQYGTMKIPKPSLYQHLSYAVEGTAHTSNQVIADQHDCPKTLSLHEHIAYGTLRSGPRLQWLNIVRGLEENILSFNRAEVGLLHTMAAWQIGPLAEDSPIREWHLELEEPRFRELLINQCFRLLERVQGNWLEANSLSVVVLLVTRLLASSNCIEDETAYELLRTARQVASKWLSELQIKLHESGTKSNVAEYQYLICEIAITCRSTFNVGRNHLSNLLKTQEDLTALINSATMLYDNQPSDVDAARADFRIRLCREYRLAHQVAPYVRQLLGRDKHILSAPLSRVWPGFKHSPQGWNLFAGPNKYWTCTTTLADGVARSQVIHFNLLNGRLLIDGAPLGRLPRSYYEDPVYIRLFGEKVLYVVPANIGGMEFATRDCVCGYQVLFALDKPKNQLIIQARKEGRTLQLVPHSELYADFPEFFSTDYHHWVDLQSSNVEFRPLSRPWSRDHCQWLITFNRWGKSLMENLENGSVLVDIHSPLFRLASAWLAPLESSRYLHVSRSTQSRVWMTLPRMKLQFFINEDMKVESYNFRGLIVDTDQSTGTLFGLQNQLVLCNKLGAARSTSRSRSVLIPHGEVSASSHHHHVLVAIDTGSDRSVRFHRYQVETDLGYLASDTGLTSRLFKIYLHALTSHCLPDSLTGRTGTEEALYELTEPATSSFEQIDEEQAILLRLIGCLTPKREYYPIHLTRMQTTSWRNIPALSQHHGFSIASAAILRRSDTLQLFFPLGFEARNYVISTKEALLKRAARRATPFYPSDSNLAIQSPDPSSYRSDHSSIIGERLSLEWGLDSQSAACTFPLLIRSKSLPVSKPFSLVSQAESWGALTGAFEDLVLTYDPKWLHLSLGEAWITMYNLIREASIRDDIYKLCFCLATIVFGQHFPLKDLPVLIAFAANPAFFRLDPPPYPVFQLQQDGYAPLLSRIQSIVASNARGIEYTPVAHWGRPAGESKKQFKARKQQEYNQRTSGYHHSMALLYLNQWPSIDPESPPASEPCSVWFDVQSCTRQVKDYFESCSRNIKLRTHFQAVEQILSSRPRSADPQVSRIMVLRQIDKYESSQRVRCATNNPPSLGFILSSRLCPEWEDAAILPRIDLLGQTGVPVETSRLAGLFNEFQKSKIPLDRQYGYELDISRRELCSKPTLALPEQLPHRQLFEQNNQICQSHFELSFEKLKRALGPRTPIERIVSVACVWPRLTARTLLGRLSLKARTQFNTSTEWYNLLIGFAKATIQYQRSRQLVGLCESGNVEELLRELDSGSGDNSDTSRCDPDWLLVQIDGNFRARSVQCQVAREMISPSTSINTALQLNMGEGKSSVIVPLIASTLANTQKLVRVIVLKPLWRQMFHLLVNRLSGLAHRRIYYLPFARDVQLDNSQVNQLQELYAECMREGGILLAQPEHVLSFKLMGIDHLVSSSQVKQTAATKLRNMQKWLTENTRDILDESDEILHVRYQLVYTVGTQRPLENHPDRWTITQQLLQITASHILRLKNSSPATLEYETTGGGQYPTIRIMPDCDQNVERLLITLIAKDVLAGRLQSLNFSRLPRSARQIVILFLTDKDISYEDSRKLLQECDEVMSKGLLLLRGLLALGVLVFALKSKHYRVDYGLDLSRSLLAVPFRAKACILLDVPSLRAEFGHPDVAVLLTCLSYYYKGLTNDQLKQCFDLLYKLDNPPLEYEQWIRRGQAISPNLLQLNGINTKDQEQFDSVIVPVFSRNSAVIEFFLSSVVFPKAAKEFPHKLATSGWDLAESKAHLTTGFSGTNDNRYLLPTSITQSDPVQQLSTNALVLTYLLQPENNFYFCMRNKDGGYLTTRKFLELLVDQKPEIRVLLDVGAQMLEFRNEELVRCWLNLKPDVEAAVCFNDRDELIVVSRNGTSSPFYSSPFSQQLDKCIVYLDDGHTRGTDLKLPRHTRALVTLGPKVTKDRLLQGCMRMRKLGHGQSIMFAAPPEIDRQIRNSAPSPISLESQVDVLDILRWAMLETCKDLRRHVSNWAQQGLDHNRRAEAEVRYTSSRDVKIVEDGWITSESRSLEDMYGVRNPSDRSVSNTFVSQVFAAAKLRERLGVFGEITLNDSRIDEEQEREVSHEVEREQQVEYPSKEQAAKHQLHQDVIRFIHTGRIPDVSPGVMYLHRPLTSSSSRAYPWSKNLGASTDFAKTVISVSPTSLSDYMRPVNWVLRGSSGVTLVLSPFEVNELLPLIRQSKFVQLHVYAPRTTHFMKSFSDLQFYSIPNTQPSVHQASEISHNQLQLDLFAGQLYLPSYEGYLLLSMLLGLYNMPNERDDQPEVQTKSDGFVMPEHRRQLAERFPEYSECRFATSPIPLLKELIGRRRKGMEYIRTHIGQVLYSHSMTPDDFNQGGSKISEM